VTEYPIYIFAQSGFSPQLLDPITEPVVRQNNMVVEQSRSSSLCGRQMEEGKREREREEGGMR
jgi:hypothetical protein